MATTGVRYFALDTKNYAVPATATRPATKVSLLWGDEVFVRRVRAGTAEVSAKGHEFEVPAKDLMADPILSWYQIDCGQGDAALIQLPDRRWIMVDAGPPTSSAPAPATQFLRWKMFTDQKWRLGNPDLDQTFRLSAVVVSHPDEDHYGGFAALTQLIEDGHLAIDAVFHNGLGRFAGVPAAKPTASTPGFSQLGPVALGPGPKDAFVTQLVDSYADVRRLSKATASRPWKLDGGYTRWLLDLARLDQSGGGVGPLQRVDRSMGTLPGFSGGAGDAAITIIGPIVEPKGRTPQLRVLDGFDKASLKGPSLTRNGHSVTLRIDYGDARLMLTGDLNFRAQALLMLNTADEELRCDVAKACHHGSEDVSWTFLQKLQAKATIFSSGDNEEYSHPRAAALGMAAALGRLPESGGSESFLGFSEKRLSIPLIYSTELSRSVELFRVGQLTKNGVPITGVKIANRPKAGDGLPESRAKGDWLLADKLVYGLVNVRTDGTRIVIGVHNEGKVGYQIERIAL